MIYTKIDGGTRNGCELFASLCGVHDPFAPLLCRIKLYQLGFTGSTVLCCFQTFITLQCNMILDTVHDDNFHLYMKEYGIWLQTYTYRLFTLAAWMMGG